MDHSAHQPAVGLHDSQSTFTAQTRHCPVPRCTVEVKMCQPDAVSSRYVDNMAQLYDDTEVAAILDDLLPQKMVRYRRRPSDPSFDDDDCVFKRVVRRLNVQHVVPVFQPTKSRGLPDVGFITSCRSRSVKTSGRRRSRLNAPDRANCGDPSTH